MFIEYMYIYIYHCYFSHIVIFKIEISSEIQQMFGLRTTCLRMRQSIIVKTETSRNNCIAWCSGFVQNDRIGVIQMIYVEPEYRRQEIGSCLLKKCEQVLVELDGKSDTV